MKLFPQIETPDFAGDAPRMSINTIYNKDLNAYNVPRNVYHAIQNAAAKTGVNFTYLVQKAAVESSFDTDAKARTSSATGLYQFIDSTWLKMVKDHGDKYGLSKYADKIDDQGHVSSAKTRREILNLRKNPEISSLMAAEFDTQNYHRLKENVGGDIGSTELYMAHFLGAGGATSFLNALKKSPDMTAADLFPDAARTNRNVFYDSKTGQPRSLRQVYAFFDNKFDGTPNNAPRSFAAQSIVSTQNTAQQAQNTSVQPPTPPISATTDPFARLTSLMSREEESSFLRISAQNTGENWKIFPPSLYSRLSLSPAQLMLLSDFNA